MKRDEPDCSFNVWKHIKIKSDTSTEEEGIINIFFYLEKLTDLTKTLRNNDYGTKKQNSRFYLCDIFCYYFIQHV